MARLVEIGPIHETQWVLTSAFNRLNLMNWLAPDLSRGVVFLPPRSCPIHRSDNFSLTDHGNDVAFKCTFFMCFIPSLIMLDSGCAPAVPSKTMTIRRDRFDTCKEPAKDRIHFTSEG